MSASPERLPRAGAIAERPGSAPNPEGMLSRVKHLGRDWALVDQGPGRGRKVARWNITRARWDTEDHQYQLGDRWYWASGPEDERLRAVRERLTRAAHAQRRKLEGA